MRIRPSRRAIVAFAVLVGLLPGADPVAAARRPHPAVYTAPVDAAVADPFRRPACTWCPGNRGLEYATAEGTPVTAAGAGIVSFAGTVAGVRWVVVDHPDGLRTSYGHLAGLAVTLGERVAARQPVGSSTARLHFGVRRGDDYLDPAPLLVGGAPVPRLVPSGGGAPRWPRAA